MATREAPTTTHTTPPCVVCGSTTHLHLDPAALAAWQAGRYVQDAFPTFSAAERELLISGTHPACWDELFGDES